MIDAFQKAESKEHCFLILCTFFLSEAQNSMVGDGFGGKSLYTLTNYSAGSYSGYTVCGDFCTEFNQFYGWGTNNTGQLGLSVHLIIYVSCIDTPVRLLYFHRHNVCRLYFNRLP